VNNAGDLRDIEQLAFRYAAAADDRDFTAFCECFLTDGVWRISTGDVLGRAAIAVHCRSVLAPLAATQHINTNFQIELNGESATMRCNFIATHVEHAAQGGRLCTIGGQYRDLIARRGGIWLFAERQIRPVWLTGDRSMLNLRLSGD
jgi:3-phenylpropionate/cinnamic acid dioxygenase small subunit